MTIAIPDFEDCPAWCNSIQVYFCQSRDPREAGKMGFAGVKVDRPVSPWVPSIGDTVFVGHPHTQVGKIENGPEAYRGTKADVFFTVVLPSGERGDWDLVDIKPFDAAKIGWSWEEI